MSQVQHNIEEFFVNQTQIFYDDYQYEQVKFELNHKQRKAVVFSFAFLFIAYQALYSTSLSSEQCIKDLTHAMTQFINAELNKNGDFAYYFMITGQIFVDMQIMVFIIFQMFKMENFFLCTFIGIFYGVRGIFLKIQKFPYPQNVYWDEPGFPPSFSVPYGITSDYFFSGHTGMMLFSLLFWSQKSETVLLKYVSMVGVPYIIVLVLSSRVHYIVDVFAAIFFSLWIYRFSKINLAYFDKLFSKGYKISIKILEFANSCLIFILRLKKGSNQNQIFV